MDFSSILPSVLTVAGIGLLIGIILAVASAVFAVPVNKKIEKLTQALPGANCGACGYSGCSGYAQALVKNNAKPGLCTVGGEKTSKKISEILGIDSAAVEKKVAAVHCKGSCDNTENKALYKGVESCLAAYKIGAGITNCPFGCIGLGDCVESCKFDSISICNGLAVIDAEKCMGCASCVAVCPRNLIKLIPYKKQAVVLCSNKQKGAVVRKICKTGCIGCMKCAKNCPQNAITVTDFCASIDHSKCTNCGLCKNNCPTGCISIIN